MIYIVFRSYGGENIKGRPDFYSKSLALASMVRAVEGTGVQVIYLNDGPIPQDKLNLMEATGEVVQIDGGPVGMRGSYRAALDLALSRDWDDEDVVYFSEDDYLFDKQAVSALVSAVEKLPQASYFALYASTPRHANLGEFPNGYTTPTNWVTQPDVEIDGQTWAHVVSTTSSFGARMGALRADRAIFIQAMLPFKTRLLDHDTCLVYQSWVPYRGLETLWGRPEDYPLTAYGVARRLVLAPFRLALNVRARLHKTPHRLYAVDPNLACHLESRVMTHGRDWEAIAADVSQWASETWHFDTAPTPIGAPNTTTA